jgi:type I site-specific restriction-modification system R (restriction) subunit
MQTIARATRVFKEKVNGLIVDYVGVFRNLEKALAIYGAGGATGDGDTPVKDKAALVTLLQQSVAEMETFCAGLGVDLDRIEVALGFDQIKLLDDAVEAIIVNDDSKKGLGAALLKRHLASKNLRVNRGFSDTLWSFRTIHFMQPRSLLEGSAGRGNCVCAPVRNETRGRLPSVH